MEYEIPQLEYQNGQQVIIRVMSGACCCNSNQQII